MTGLIDELRGYHDHCMATGQEQVADLVGRAMSTLTQQQEAELVGWTWQGALDSLKQGYCSEGVVIWPHKSPGTPIALYTHPQPAVPEGWLSEAQQLIRAIDGANWSGVNIGNKSIIYVARELLDKLLSAAKEEGK